MRRSGEVQECVSSIVRANGSIIGASKEHAGVGVADKERMGGELGVRYQKCEVVFLNFVYFCYLPQ
jgi:hypothetical protein